ncbi:MAG: transcription initiation factor IIB family protein [Desulfurococcaceae archaeon]
MKCGYCGCGEILYDFTLHAYVCPTCGTVLEDRPILMSAEKNLKENHVPRYSGSFTHRVHDHGVGGTEIAGNITRHIVEGRTWVMRNIDVKFDKQHRRLVKALRELNNLAKRLNAPSAVIETAGEILHKVMKDVNVKEQTLRRVVAAALFTAYKKCGYPRPIKLFAREVGLEEGDLWDGLRKLSELDKDTKTLVESNEPRFYVNYVTSSLKLPPEIGALASEIVGNVREHPVVSGKSPASLAAAAVYLASILLNSRKTQMEVGSTVGQTDVAIRNAYSALVRALDIYVIM